jgi:uncharacterized membrane protein
VDHPERDQGGPDDAAQQSPRGFSLAFDWLHLLAGSVWLGGLIGLLVLWQSTRSDRRVPALGTVVPRFSNVAFVSVLVLIASGTGATIFHMPAVNTLWQTSYGVAILVKIGLISLAALIASGNPTQVPASLDAKVVDGDQRMWLRVPPSETLLVLDYRGAPYLRFSRAGIAVNQNSVMYYLNQTPIALTPPANLTPATSPSWQLVSGAHEYQWHDGRLHALTATALVPGTEYVGRWTIPIRLNGRLSALAGGLWHAENPPLVWFWPVVVLFTCVLAARRLRRPALDARLAPCSQSPPSPRSRSGAADASSTGDRRPGSAG